MKLLLIWLVCFFFIGCVPATDRGKPEQHRRDDDALVQHANDRAVEELPPFVEELIKKYTAEPVSNPPMSIWKYKFRDIDVFYVPPFCCDMPSKLYDGAGNVLCSPGGGITGRGDRRCPNFNSERSDGLLIWKDSRLYSESKGIPGKNDT